MLAKLIKNNLPYICSQILGADKGKIAYPFVQAIFDLVSKGNYQNALTQFAMLLALEGIVVPKVF